MTGIYKITNKENGLMYIGKAKNIYKRWQEHKNDSYCLEEKWEANNRKEQTYFHRALRKRKPEDFKWEIIEECSENELNEKEIYWIEYYHTWIHDPLCQGYNMTKGGDGYSCGGGEKAPGAKITQQDCDIIKQKLKEHWTAAQIQTLIPQATSGIISNINYGKSWFDPNEKYPISINNGHRKFDDDKVLKIRQEWQKGANIQELADKYGMNRDSMSNLVRGITYTNVPILERDVDYKRSNYEQRKFTDEEVKYFRQQVKNGKSIKSLYEKECNVKCCYAAFYNMIKGKTYKNVL